MNDARLNANWKEDEARRKQEADLTEAIRLLRLTYRAVAPNGVYGTREFADGRNALLARYEAQP